MIRQSPPVNRAGVPVKSSDKLPIKGSLLTIDTNSFWTSSYFHAPPTTHRLSGIVLPHHQQCHSICLPIARVRLFSQVGVGERLPDHVVIGAVTAGAGRPDLGDELLCKRQVQAEPVVVMVVADFPGGMFAQI